MLETVEKNSGAGDASPLELKKAFFADFVKMQAELPKISVNKKVTMNSGNASYKYADLANVLNNVRPLLTKHNMFISQEVLNSKTGSQCAIRTILGHTSGYERVSEYSIPLAILAGKYKNPIKEAGSAITYGRRYTLLAMLGISPEGDDNDARGFRPPKNTPPQPKTYSEKEILEASVKKIQGEGKVDPAFKAKIVGLLKNNNNKESFLEICKVIENKSDHSDIIDQEIDKINLDE